MGIITKAFERRSQLTNPEAWLLDAVGYRPSRSGVNVSANVAINSSVVWRATTLLGGVIGSLSLPVYKRMQPRGKEKDPGHRLYYKLHDRPNPEMSKMTWLASGIAHQLIWGNWYNEIEFNNGGHPVNFWPLPPWNVTPRRDMTGKLLYEVALPNGQTRRLDPAQVLHVKNLYLDGDKGMSCLQAGREAIGLGLAVEEFGANFFGQGANIGGIVEYPGKLGDNAFDRYKKSVRESYEGISKSHRLMFLEQGLKYHRVGIPPNDGQMLETRKFQVAEIGRFFFITQLHKLGDLEKATFSNIEEQGIDFVVDTVRPLLVNIEQEFNYKLFHVIGEDDRFTEFVVDSLLRGDSKARAEFYNKLFMIGGFSVNDILELENRNPIGPEGDKRFVPMNMVPLDQVDAFEPKEQGEPEPIERAAASTEKRNLNAAKSRARLANRFERVINDAATRLVKGESADIRRATKKHLAERDAVDFLVWLEGYYSKMPERIRRTMFPAFSTFAEMITIEAQKEVGVENTADVDRFVGEYMEAYSARHVGSSRGQIQALIRDAPNEGRDPAEAIDERLGEWEERRPGKIASNETVQIANAVARFVFVAAGIQRLRWVAIGSDSCPYCQELDGRVVGIERPFLGKSDTLESDDGRMQINRPTTHPPLHQGCVCQITPD